MIARELDNIPNEKVRNITREYLDKDRAGRARLPLLKKGRGAAGIPRPIIKGGFPWQTAALPPPPERVHIAFFGRRNAGKSSLVNALTGQSVAIVSPVAGTTTDPVRKSMELLPLRGRW